jgi:predicted Fe-Mo cluster-binding NifX family protein
MRVAITSQGAEMSSATDPRFGRAKFFVVADMETGAVEAHDNAQNLNAAQGAGIQAAQNVANLGVEAVVTGNVGPKAFATLRAGNIDVCIGAAGSVEHALEQFKAGELECVTEANVEGHWV